MHRAIVVAMLAFALPLAPAPDGRPPQEVRVLFIGNSLTSMHDVPALVEQISSSATRRIRASMVTKNDFSLDDHWQDGDARRAIDQGGWAFVVLQQGPSALPESRVQLRAAVAKFAPVIRAVGATPALYMVWPSSARRGDFDRVRDSYALAASDVDGIFIPAGDAWREAWRRDPALPLYAADGFHPTLAGSRLAAEAIVKALTAGIRGRRVLQVQ